MHVFLLHSNHCAPCGGSRLHPGLIRCCIWRGNIFSSPIGGPNEHFRGSYIQARCSLDPADNSNCLMTKWPVNSFLSFHRFFLWFNLMDIITPKGYLNLHSGTCRALSLGTDNRIAPAFVWAAAGRRCRSQIWQSGDANMRAITAD